MNGTGPRPERVALVAAKIRTALSPDLDGTWDALIAGRSAVRAIDWFDASGFGAPHAARIPRESEAIEDDPTLRILGQHGRILEEVLREAHEASGARSVPREAVGLYVASGMVDSPVEELAPAALAARGADGELDLATFFRSAYRLVHPLWPLSTLNNIVAGQVAADLDVRGDNLVLSSDAAAGMRVLVEGLRAVREGIVRCALVGGVGEPVTPASLTRLRLRGGLGRGRPDPLSSSAGGIAPGEGGGAVALRGHGELGEECRPLAFLSGGATAFGAAESAGATLARVMRDAVADAGLDSGEVDSVFLHGEGTSLDHAELAALEDVFGRGRAELALVATKGALGHAGAGGPLIDVALAVRALESGRLPATVTGESLEPGAAGILRAGSHSPRRILVVAAGSAGGAGAVLVEVGR